MGTYIGLDLGGTKIRAGRVAEQILETQNQVRTPKSPKDEQETIRAIHEVIRAVMNDQVEAIGVGVPSVVDRSKGVVYDVVNIPHWKEVHLKAILEKEWSVPVVIDNDANCFALGQRYFGVGRDYDHFVGLTIGTGLGGGIIQKGALLADANCGSGEFGMIPYREHVLEYYASGSFFKNVYGVDGHEMFLRASKQDEEALEAFRLLGEHLAEAVKIVMLTVDPEMIVFGGSVAEAHHLFEESLQAHLGNFAYTKSVENLDLFFSKLDNTAILGAASLCY